MGIQIHQYNKMQATLSERLCDALDDYIEASRAYKAEQAADTDRPEGTARDMEGLERAYNARIRAGHTLAARIQNVTGIDFDVTARRVF